MAQIIGRELFSELIEILEAELRVYQALGETCRQERESLISSQSTEIRRMTSVKESLLQKARDTDVQREKVARELGKELGLGLASPRLKTLIEKAPEKEAAQLRALQTGLEIEVARIKELNEMNGRLIAAALENVRGALGSIRGTLSEKPVYKKEGRVETKTLAGQLVSREA